MIQENQIDKYTFEYYCQCVIDYRNFFKKHDLTEGEAIARDPEIEQLLCDLETMEAMGIADSFNKREKV